MSAGLRSRRVHVRVVLRALKGMWRRRSAHLPDKQEDGCSSQPIPTVAVAQRIRAPGRDPGDTGESPVGHPTGGSSSGRAPVS